MGRPLFGLRLSVGAYPNWDVNPKRISANLSTNFFPQSALNDKNKNHLVKYIHIH